MTTKTYPRAIQKLLPEHASQPRIIPTQAIVHSIVGSARSAYNYFRDGTKIESHLILPYQGVPWQVMDLDRQADANYRANRRPDGTGAHSMETEDNRSPDTDPWTASQVDEIIAWILWEHDTYGIPLRVCRTPSDPGFGYHTLHPHDWTNVPSKTCPGRVRIEQFYDVIVPALTAGNGRAPRTPDHQEEEDMATVLAHFRTKAGSNDKMHTYRVTGNVASWCGTQEEIAVAEYFGVPWFGPLDPPLWKSLAVINGPLANQDRR